MFETKDEKLSKLEKKVLLLDKKADRKFERIEENFEFFRALVIEMQNDNRQLRKDRDYLLKSYKGLLDRLYDSALSEDLRSVVEPMRNSLIENFNLIKEAGRIEVQEKKRKK
ncbi:MAG: hypothetical protein QMD97_04505 [Candidatus Aenigmarchaeota archaeon]|nr:hypothetical protein [Candidatus Aenigmarchaeota archaeon]